MKISFICYVLGLLCFVQLSCANKSNHIQQRVDTVYLNDSVFSDVDLHKLPSNFVFNDHIERVDTTINGYHIVYTLRTSGEFHFVRYYGNLPVFTRDMEVLLSIDNDETGMHINRKIQKSNFSEYIPKTEIKKYDMCSFLIERVNKNGVILSPNFCLPDTDICYMFELHFNNAGEMKIVPIDEGSMGED